jgi:hypothetical protein
MKGEVTIPALRAGIVISPVAWALAKHSSRRRIWLAGEGAGAPVELPQFKHVKETRNNGIL